MKARRPKWPAAPVLPDRSNGGAFRGICSLVTIDRPTIFALSSGRPPAAVAVIRICGPQAGLALKALTGRLPPPRGATLVRVRNPASGEILDEALALWFPGPRSETGEDMAELQLHGGQAVVSAALRALAEIDGCRLAEPGEFTRRAFENGRLDLTEVEGLADLIAAETPAQRRQAYRQLKGLIGDQAEVWRRQIIEAMALVEARIDFSDEADVPEDLVRPALYAAQQLRSIIATALADGGRGERLRDGIVVAIAGPPNAGKSTLLNRLAKREAALVSPHPGTTRDVIEVHLDFGGYPVTLLDTAGIRESTDPVEREGVRRASERATAADLVLWVIDGSASGREIAAVQNLKNHDLSEAWLIANKVDLAGEKLWIKSESESASWRQKFAISAAEGTGMDALVAALAAHAERFFATTESSLITRARHRQALEETVAALDRAIALGAEAQRELKEELIAEELRTAATTLGRLTGRVDVEDILDVIFRDFCIGK
jgi:tRNA modification GTPase